MGPGADCRNGLRTTGDGAVLTLAANVFDVTKTVLGPMPSRMIKKGAV